MTGTAGAAKKHILVVDDEVDTHKFFKDFLTAEGYKVTCAFGWRDAVAHLSKNSPHLIILDVLMPEIDGFTISETMKQEMNLQVPILIYSALNRPAEIMRGLTKGCNAFLCKPALLGELRETITYLLDERAREAPDKSVSPG